MLTIGIVGVSADEGVILPAAISGALDADMWNDPSKIVEGKLYPSAANGSTYEVTSVDSYNLGTEWSASIDFTTPTYFGGLQEPTRLVVGDIEAVAVNAQKNTNPLVEGYIALKVKGQEKGTRFSLGVGSNEWNSVTSSGGYAGTLSIDYKDGAVKVHFNAAEVITYDATADDLDFSAAEVTLSVKGNWQTGSDKFSINGFGLDAANVGGGSSSTPDSSAPESSEAPVSSAPESSEAPISSAPESSEAPISSAPESSEAPVSSAPESSEAPVSSDPSSETSSSAPVAEKIITPISGTLVAEMWDPAESIVSGAFSTGAHANVITVTSVKKYDLGTDWTASMKLATGSYMGNDEGQPSRLIVGEVEGIIYNSNKNTGADPYIALKVKGAEVGTYQLPASASTLNNGHSGVLTLTYKDGAIKLLYKDEEVISYDASGDSLDFSAINFGLSLKGNWVANEDKFSITEFAVVTADCIPELGEPIVDVTDAAFNAEDWTGDTAVIDTTAGYFSPGNATSANRTISSAKKYNLSEGFKFSSKLYFKNSYANYYGESAVMYVGDVGEGIELHIKNTAGQGLYTGSLVVNGEEVATVDLLNTPNGTYEMVYKNGKLTVNLEGAAISWNVPDGTSTSITIEDVDLSSARLNFSIAGNWATADRRHWSNWSLTSVTGGGVGGGGGTTGDARNLIVPAVAIVLGACAVAFVATRKKTEA